MTISEKWDFWIDRGGTFTDIVARAPDGSLKTHKLLSENPENYPDAAMQGIRDFLGVSADAPIPAENISSVKMGTTVATNALLERKGDAVLFLTNQGFADALEIGYQARPRLFDREIVKPSLLYHAVAQVPGRILADGTVEQGFDPSATRVILQRHYDDGLRALAITFMHSYRYRDHEVQAAQIAREIGFTQISPSHEVSKLIKFVGRGDTAVVDAYLSPILARYVDHVARELAGSSQTKLMFMMSSGGLTDAKLFSGRDAILSGPAGGIVGAVETSKLAGFEKIIGFDMGGTSTDVAHYAGEFETSFETEIAGVRMRAPMLKIHTVAAGGGSILRYDGARFRVGPQSAGANPGPASYRRGGSLTVTDANIMLGKLRPEFFPSLFGPNQDQPLDGGVVRDKFEQIANQSGADTIYDCAEGFLKIAVENMANAVKKISVQRGYDVTRYALTCFGGAGGQHACAVAQSLGMSTILIHPFSGILSAYGMGLADLKAARQITLETVLTSDSLTALEHQVEDLGADASSELQRQGVPESDIALTPSVHLKYQGTDSTLGVPLGTMAEMVAKFEQKHREQFGFVMAQTPLVIELVSLEASGGGAQSSEIKYPPATTPPQIEKQTEFYANGQWHTVPVYHREILAPGHQIAGPAMIIEDIGTIIIEPGWRGELNDYRHLILHRDTSRSASGKLSTELDPVMLEIFNNLFMSIAEQMGVTLQNTARSVNIKERLDFSCALFDATGALIANAPHTPVHLGSMDRSVESVINAHPEMARGDVFVTNAPYNGGTHLPDITVVTPIFHDEGAHPTFFLASRGHHADIGGIAPGSMTPLATNINQEGIVLENLVLVRKGKFLEEEIRDKLNSKPYPCRNTDQNVADLKAQIAANEKGIKELENMVASFGLEVIHAYMNHVQDYAEECVRRVIDKLGDGSACVEFDQGCKVKVSLSIDKKSRTATLDFTGTSAQQGDNFNAPEPVTRAAVLYTFRCMVDDDIPMNAGCMRPLNIILPEKSMLTPQYPAAVVAGNVEVSQAVTDCLFAALGALAGAQGTMNNFNFGNETIQYYETICGGAGAGPGFAGASAVHTHMTNTRLTDPEILELRYPVVLEKFQIRRGSGGKGHWRGGDGLNRTIRFLEEMEISFLCGRRKIAPAGLAGGGNGALGRNDLRRANGKIEQMSGRVQFKAYPGDAVLIQTPSGGGYGKKDP